VWLRGIVRRRGGLCRRFGHSLGRGCGGGCRVVEGGGCRVFRVRRLCWTRGGMVLILIRMIFCSEGYSVDLMMSRMMMTRMMRVQMPNLMGQAVPLPWQM